ncbi:MAG: hypothetical protein EP329_00045 [Deltaproteobacteria bacterium]|nr:MAG: hypothetical protein EP329_00045 [Deltaproteobacteria bacterium]
MPPRRLVLGRVSSLFALLALAGCGAESAPSTDAPVDGPAVAIDIAALNLQGVGDAVWDIEVDNGGGGVVFQRRITSSGYGDGGGSASYLGPCDADPAVAENTVKVWVVGLYSGAVSDAGVFASGSASGAGAVTGTPVDFQNPTSDGPLTRIVTCQANADAYVQFDVALMRPAQQGFFDIAVNFNDIFCSAKLDCCYDTNDNGCEAGEEITLLFDASGQRARTFVLGFACTAGPSADVATDLYLDPIALDCTAPNSGVDFVADLRLDVTGGPGNLCAAGDLAGCAAVEPVGATDPDAYLFQVATYRGTEALTSGGAPAQKAYWNVALGALPGVSACRLRTRGTADDANNDGDNVVNGAIAAGTVYPYVQWDVALDATCGSEPLSFADPGAAVTTTYTTTGGAELTFAYHFAPGLPAGAFCDPACQHGGACLSGVCDCSATGYEGSACETPICTTPCQNGGTCIGPDTCDCAGTGYEGATCETPSCTTPCQNGGSCVAPDTCDCAGTGYGGATCETALCGASSGEAAISCKDILATCPWVTSDVRWIDPNGGDTSDAFQVLCDQSTGTGGWTVIVSPANTLAHCDAYQSNGGSCSATLMSSTTPSSGQTFCTGRVATGFNNSIAAYCFDEGKFAGMPVDEIVFTNSNSSTCGQPWGARWYTPAGVSSTQTPTGSNQLITGVTDLGAFISEVGCPGYTNLTLFMVR